MFDAKAEVENAADVGFSRFRQAVIMQFTDEEREELIRRYLSEIEVEVDELRIYDSPLAVRKAFSKVKQELGPDCVEAFPSFSGVDLLAKMVKLETIIMLNANVSEEHAAKVDLSRRVLSACHFIVSAKQNGFQNIVFASRNPLTVNCKRTSLHCEYGPALLYADGYMVFAIEGVVFDEKVILRPELITDSEIAEMSEKAQEIVRKRREAAISKRPT